MVSGLSTTITILSVTIFSSIIADAQNQPYLNVSFGNQSDCSISDIDVDYSSKVNLCLGNRHYECYWTDNGNNNNGNSNYDNEDNDQIINYNNLLKMMNCFHVDNDCQRNRGLVMFDCVYPNSTAIDNGAQNNSQNDCILSQYNNNFNGTVDLQCKVIIDTRVRKAYIAAFIAVIVLLVFLFCVCPLCCVYYYCRYTNTNRPSYYSTNNAANYETQQFGNNQSKCSRSKNGNKMGWMHTTRTEKTTMKVNNSDKVQEMETQPMYNNNYNQTDCDNDRHVQHEIVV